MVIGSAWNLLQSIFLISEFHHQLHFPFLSDFFSAGVFPIPEYLNKSVVSLLCHMLQTDPMRRASAEDIHKHEWFQKDLPPYLFPDRDVDVALIDHEALAMVCEVSILKK
jgi:5'-AMP-activated protein kinase catalytic alpha subunit